SKAKRIIDSKSVFVNDRRVWMASHMLNPGDRVSVNTEAQDKPADEIRILYRDENIIAVDKAAGMLSDGNAGSVEDLLRKKMKNPGIRAIHRLDRDTTGVNLFAADTRIFEAYKRMWEEKEVTKKYLAICEGEARFSETMVKIPVDGKPAMSYVRTLSKGYGITVFGVEIQTGRKHQIRVHLSSLGHPVLGDKEYGEKTVRPGWKKDIKRQMLHAAEISFVCPLSGKRIEIKPPLPADFKKAAALAGYR
ncbi:MAG TPA: RluA family pseudouridine synthase, partial [Candidatus Goldiibacteriota bacterium]|nr:RluA family pseudouridine synthase [Candidatus Goldiibacteriota bacterium]